MIPLVDLCCGAGGVAEGASLLGMSSHGFDTAADAVEVHNTIEGASGSVKDLSLLPVQKAVASAGSHDKPWGLHASVPCQMFSTAGNGTGPNGFPWLFGVLECCSVMGWRHPSWVTIENVKGLVQHRRKAGCDYGYAAGDRSARARKAHGDGLRPNPSPDPSGCPRCYFDHVVLRTLREHYDFVDWRVLNAADYGVPQKRLRVFVIASDEPFSWPEPTHSGPALALAKADGRYWRSVGMAGPPEGFSFTKEEERWLRKPMREAFACLPWRTTRQALGLGTGLVAAAAAAAVAEARGERPSSTDEPAPTIATKANQFFIDTNQNTGALGAREKHRVGVDTPSPTVRCGGGGRMTVRAGRPGCGLRVVGGGRNPTNKPGDRRTYRDLTDTPSTTVCAQTGGGAGNAGPWVVHGTAPKGRILTPRECALLQGFSENWIENMERLTENKPKKVAYRMVGNAVPPLLAAAVFRALVQP